MKPLVILVLVLGLAGCQGAIDAQHQTDGGDPTPTCSSGYKLKCINDIDDGTICTCEQDAFDPCVKYPEKYCAPMPVPPDGGTDWTCTWTEFKYSCTRPDNGKTPTGGSGWSCTANKDGGWTCVKSTIPMPGGGGEWTCFVDNESDALVCEPKPGGKLTWKCTTGVDGKQTCTSSGGLPPGGSNWQCHKSGGGWLCYGDTPAGSTPPGGGGWQCVKTKTEFGKDIYKCENPGDDVPPGGGSWTCVKGSEFGGTTCYEGPPGVPPAVGGTCKVGDKAWCDGNIACAWGQVMCDPKTGTWETEVYNGKKRLKCYETAQDLRPNTKCGCYFYFFNEDCCERPDCIIPAGTNGQTCPASQGKLCDYCHPQNPECSESGGKCILTDKYESFCGRGCSASALCPGGYTCKTLTKSGVSYKQCVPADFSCYY